MWLYAGKHSFRILASLATCEARISQTEIFLIVSNERYVCWFDLSSDEWICLGWIGQWFGGSCLRSGELHLGGELYYSQWGLILVGFWPFRAKVKLLLPHALCYCIDGLTGIIHQISRLNLFSVHMWRIPWLKCWSMELHTVLQQLLP